jgi:hypothetical protein
MTTDLTPYKNCLAHKHSLYISTEDKPYKPCCWFKGGVTASTFDEYQLKLKDADIEKGCNHCIKQDQAGVTWTHRSLFKSPRELVIGVCLDNICNIKCITCSPYHSSQHIAEWDKLNKFKLYNLDKKKFIRMMNTGPEKLKLVEDTILTNDSDSIRLEIFGGEPLINPLVIDFIKWLTTKDYARKTNLVITTNGTTSIDVIANELKSFNQVTIQYSVDGYKELFDTMRFGADFDEMEKNARELQTLSKHNPNIKYGFHYTLSWLNADGFFDFYNWVSTNFIDAQTLHLTKITGPHLYVVELIPYPIIQELLGKANSLKIPLDSNGNQRIDFEQLIDLYKQSLENIVEPDLDTFLKNKRNFQDAISELGRLFSIRNIKIDALPLLEPIRQFFRSTLPPYPAEYVIKKYCVGTEEWGTLADGQGSTYEKMLVKDSYHCGWRPEIEPRGHLYSVFCKDVDQWGRYADGEGGVYEELIQENSMGCGFKLPPEPRGHLYQVFCKGVDEWGKFADGEGGFYEMLLTKDCVGCGFEHPKLEKGFLVESFCKGMDEWGKFADGEGGTYEELVQENSYGCGFRHPPLERGFLVEVFCKGPDEWGKYADGNYGYYEELRIKDSMYCQLANNKDSSE